MRLIIDIPQSDYDFISQIREINIGSRGGCKTIQKNVIEAIKQGTPAPREIFSPMTACKFGDLKKGDRFCYEEDKMIKTCRIKAGNDGAFYTAVSIVTGNHYCIADDLEVYV